MTTTTDNPIAEYLKTYHKGAQSVISSRELEAAFHIRGPDLRRLINSLRGDGIPICSSDSGYYYAGTEEELQRDHAGIPHGGFVLRTGKTGLNGEHNHVIEYSLKLDSNPEFTSCVLTAYARAAYRMNQEGQKGCKTVFDVAPAYLSTLTPEEMRSALL